MDIEIKLQNIFREVFDNPEMEISDDMSADDVSDWTSLTHMQLLATIEEEFGIEFNTRDIRRMKNIGDLKRSIERKLG